MCPCILISFLVNIDDFLDHPEVFIVELSIEKAKSIYIQSDILFTLLLRKIFSALPKQLEKCGRFPRPKCFHHVMTDHL